MGIPGCLDKQGSSGFGSLREQKNEEKWLFAAQKIRGAAWEL
jgi:hypothetical protein